jgi:hypothetical protein
MFGFYWAGDGKSPAQHQRCSPVDFPGQLVNNNVQLLKWAGDGKSPAQPPKCSPAHL